MHVKRLYLNAGGMLEYLPKIINHELLSREFVATNFGIGYVMRKS